MISTLLDSVELSGSHLSTRVVTKGLSCMRKIKLTQGKHALVDDADYEYLKQLKWRYYPNRGSSTGYAISRFNGDRKVIYMHRVLLEPDLLEKVDHRNGNGLDNRRKNLRICTHAENTRNRRVSKNNTSGFTGVKRFKLKYTYKWRATICYNWKIISLGLFKLKSDAVKARKEAEKKLYGEFAYKQKRNPKIK